MTNLGSATVAVDAMGGDTAPGVVLAGVEDALASDPGLRIALAGPDDVVTAFCSSHDRCSPLIATEVISMDEHPANAVRAKRDSSIVRGCRLVREGGADAFFSAGSTGACMTAATLHMGRVKGVKRPAIATVIPTGADPVILLDVGANADCRPEHLVQFAHMGAAYSRIVLGVETPSVALLNIGEEPTKGSVLSQEAYRLMAEQVRGFAGNIEGREVVSGAVDVVVTDGFTGNVALKLLEGVSSSLLGQVKAALTATPLSRIGALTARGPLTALKARLDPDTYGGAPLLGVDGVCIIGHGSSGRTAVSAAIEVATRAVHGGLTAAIAERMAEHGRQTDAQDSNAPAPDGSSEEA